VTDGPFDLVFIDADKQNNAGYLEWALRLTHPGSVIVVDNVIREGAILSSDPDDVVGGTLRALELMSERPELDTAVLQTVGAKHWDGFALGLVK
jgi:predicted O-methyltransferase YrrM